MKQVEIKMSGLTGTEHAALIAALAKETNFSNFVSVRDPEEAYVMLKNSTGICPSECSSQEWPARFGVTLIVATSKHSHLTPLDRVADIFHAVGLFPGSMSHAEAI